MTKTLLFLIALIVLSNAYTQTKAKKYAGLAYASYCSPKQLINWTLGVVSYNYPNVHDVTIIENTSKVNYIIIIPKDLRAYIIYDEDDNTIVVTFRGSQNISNWLSNIDFIFTDYTPCDKCKVHKGFYNAYLNL